MNPTLQWTVLGVIVVGIVVAIVVLQPRMQRSAPVSGNQYHELVSPSGFINTQPFTLADLVGKKVILVDFWAYSCINCQRTFPYLNNWYAKYHDKGLEIVGIHSPEFAFEKSIDNVRTAVEKFGIKYPVVLDNDMATWNAYQNQYWPAEYVIDLNGNIIHTHFGEGEYDVTERAIEEALHLDMPITTPSGAPTVDFSRIRTPELYLGSLRNADALGNGQTAVNTTQTLVMPPEKDHQDSTVYLEGTWKITPEYAQNLSAQALLHIHYIAKQVNIVAGSATGAPIHVHVLVDGHEVGIVTVTGQTLYTVFDAAQYGDHDLMLRADEPGLQVFTLTFG